MRAVYDLATMHIASVVLAVGLATLTGLTASSALPAPAMKIVPCDEVIGRTTFPYLDNNRPEHRYRQVLGVAAVPPAYMQQVVETGWKPWIYWRKQGLVVRATGAAVTVSVPKAWRKRAAINWGNRPGPVSSLRIAGCRVAANVGNAYAGGFYLRSASACVPLVFSVGKRSATVRFGVGQPCRP